MHTVNETEIAAPSELCFQLAADVERWPELLPHYRRVGFRRPDGFGAGLVEMAARRDFGPLPYPVWWVSEMTSDPAVHVIRYRHVAGVTTGMEVEWSFHTLAHGGTRVRVVHDWELGPAWPLPGIARRKVAEWIIGPFFIHHVAGRTLAGVKREAERRRDA